MAESKSFVDKVYDSYIKEDYSYGDDNLNPRREINVNNLRKTDDDLNRIMAAIQAKVTEIGIKYVDMDFDSGINVDANFTTGTGTLRKGIPTTLKNAISKAGGDNDSLIHIPSLTGSPNPIIEEIEILIPTLIGIIGGDPNRDPSDEGPDDIPPIFDGLDLFEVDCNGTFNPITKSTNSNTGEGDDTDGDSLENQAGVKKNNNSLGGEGSGSGSGSGSSSSGGGSGLDNNDFDTTTSSGDDTLDSEINSAIDKALSKIDNNVDKYQDNARTCAMRDLKLLEVFLAILRVIQVLKKAINPLLNILMDVAKIVVLAAGCWVNPTGITEIIQRIVCKLMAIMVMIIAQLVQMFWEMLGLDCFTSQTQNTIEQIKAAMTGVTKTYKACERTAIQFGQNVEELHDAFDEAKDAINEALKNLTDDNFREQYKTDLKNAVGDIYRNSFGNIENVKNMGVSAIQSTGAYDDIVKTLESVKSLKSEAEKTIDTLMKTQGGKAADQTVRKIASQLHNVQAV